MFELFSAIVGLTSNRRLNALKKFLELNENYSDFEILPLVPSSCHAYGSIITDLKEKIKYLSSIKPLLTGRKYLKHLNKIENDIESSEIRIKNIEIRELLE